MHAHAYVQTCRSGSEGSSLRASATNVAASTTPAYKMTYNYVWTYIYVLHTYMYYIHICITYIYVYIDIDIDTCIRTCCSGSEGSNLRASATNVSASTTPAPTLCSISRRISCLRLLARVAAGETPPPPVSGLLSPSGIAAGEAPPPAVSDPLPRSGIAPLRGE